MKRKVISKVIGISVMFLIIGLMLGDLADSQGGIVNANPSQLSLSTGTPTVPFFSQRDQRWKDDPIIDETGIMQGTIGSIGCAMTSTAMILKYYGVDTDPKQLNSWLNANKGYAVGGRLYWRKPADYSQGKVIYRDDLSKPIPQDWPTNNDWWEDLNQNLKQGRLVVVCVDAYLSTPQLETHYVLVTGFKGGAVNYPGNYYINDPWDLTFNPDKTLLTYWDHTYDNTFFAMRVYESSQLTTQTITVTTVSTVTTTTNVALTYTTTTSVIEIDGMSTATTATITTITTTLFTTRLTTVYSPTYTITESLTATGLIIPEFSTSQTFLGVTLTISLCILGLLFLYFRGGEKD
jgi:uncharacterized protein YvpB